jgi:hypothetical protein
MQAKLTAIGALGKLLLDAQPELASASFTVASLCVYI